MPLRDEPWLLTALIRLIRLAVMQQQWERAARLLGAHDRQLNIISDENLDMSGEKYGPLVETLKAELGEANWEAALTAGRAMTLNQVVQYALNEAET